MSDAQVERLRSTLELGALAAGYDDERWTLARVVALIRTLFHRTVSLQTLSVLLRRMGWSPQLPKHQARERDEAAITHWRRYTWPAIKGSRAGWARSSALPTSFADESGLTLKPAKARTWAPRGNTPVIRVPGRRGPRLSIAGMVGYRPGARGRLFYRQVIHRGRKNEPKGLREQDFARLLDTAHQQLSAPIILVWDKLPGHRSILMRQFIAARSWLHVYYLPAYAPN